MSVVSESASRYMSAILLLSIERERPAKTGELADRLDVSAASVTEMLSTLEAQGLAAHEKYEGATLTDEGERLTRELIWKRCVAGTFLERDLDVDAGEHGLGHALSDDVADRLRRRVDHPCDGECRAPRAEYDECRDDVRELK